LAAVAVALPAISHFAWAQSYPTRPITMIVALAPGSAIDVIGRVLADRMSKVLLQPIVVENVTGAEGSIGAGRVARARSDGYTFAMGAISTQVMNGALYSLPYDVLSDFAPISPVATAPYILFARKMPAKDVKELIAWLKANPNKASAGISFGSSREQSRPHRILSEGNRDAIRPCPLPW
jgi:tripartite-type tricarboxylate transporter receptor subunit TctC